MNLNYLKCRKAIFDFSTKWDIFVSAYNSSDRVQETFKKVLASNKSWVSIPEYDYKPSEFPSTDHVVTPIGNSEAEVINAIVNYFTLAANDTRSICIDITGFMRPHILYLVKCLRDLGINRYDIIYSEPEQYRLKENTLFTESDVDCVRQVIGYEGTHDDSMNEDILIVGVGYDDALISRVANDKDGARFIQLLSLPSLSADMYQESILRLDRASVARIDETDDLIFFAPANDPFVVANELSEKLKEISNRCTITNIYLCPLATKVQALGFALFYIHELSNSPASILFPFTSNYSRETSKGIGKTWIYEIE
jgi:hypothetical protein